MRILIADAMEESRLDRLRNAGHEVVIEPSLSSDQLAARVPGFDVLVVRSTKVNAEALSAGDCLGLVVRAGAGVDNIDMTTASALGIHVSNVPGVNALAVAELAMGLLLAVDRRIADGTADLRAGTWNKTEYRKADGLATKTVGIVGVGSIGLAFAERAKAFGMQAVAVRRDGRSAEIEQRIRSVGIRLVDDLDALLSVSDVVSIHVPKAPDTTGLVNAEFLAKMKPDAILLNTARGETMVADDVIMALDNGLRAGLDVFPDEPSSGTADFDSVLARHPNVVGTHHIGASTTQAQVAVVEATIDLISAYGTGEVRNCVNLDTSTEGKTTITIRHEDKVGVLAQVFAVLRSHGLNVQQMRNEVFSGRKAAVAVISTDGSLGEAEVAELRAIDEVFGVQVTEGHRS